jgi:hypothetical protein
MFWTILLMVLTGVITFGICYITFFLKNMKLLSEHRQYRRKAIELDEALSQKDNSIQLEIKARDRKIEILNKKVQEYEAEKLARLQAESSIKNEQFEVLQTEFDNYKQQAEKQKIELQQQIENLLKK